ncbi:MAG: TetR family transcriptional regulator [Acidimicrobiaceae bacterium]|nr:MAG: TetR family transcriptional regulator [Acidimicrobiaceae bacterium]
MARTKEFDPDVAVATAIEVFWDRGYAGTSMQDLVDELGLNRGSIYGTFGSKHDLFVQALTEYCKRAPQALLDALEIDGPLLPRLRGALIGLIDADLADPDRKGCLLVNSAMETLPADRDTAALYDRTARTLRTAFEAAVRRAQLEGELPRSLNPVDAASFLLTTLQGLRVTAKATGDRQPLVASVDFALRALH